MTALARFFVRQKLREFVIPSLFLNAFIFFIFASSDRLEKMAPTTIIAAAILVWIGCLVEKPQLEFTLCLPVERYCLVHLRAATISLLVLLAASPFLFISLWAAGARGVFLPVVLATFDALFYSLIFISLLLLVDIICDSMDPFGRAMIFMAVFIAYLISLGLSGILFTISERYFAIGFINPFLLVIAPVGSAVFVWLGMDYFSEFELMPAFSGESTFPVMAAPPRRYLQLRAGVLEVVKAATALNSGQWQIDLPPVRAIPAAEYPLSAKKKLFDRLPPLYRLIARTLWSRWWYVIFLCMFSFMTLIIIGSQGRDGIMILFFMPLMYAGAFFPHYYSPIRGLLTLSIHRRRIFRGIIAPLFLSVACIMVLVASLIIIFAATGDGPTESEWLAARKVASVLFAGLLCITCVLFSIFFVLSPWNYLKLKWMHKGYLPWTPITLVFLWVGSFLLPRNMSILESHPIKTWKAGYILLAFVLLLTISFALWKGAERAFCRLEISDPSFAIKGFGRRDGS